MRGHRVRAAARGCAVIALAVGALVPDHRSQLRRTPPRPRPPGSSRPALPTRRRARRNRLRARRRSDGAGHRGRPLRHPRRGDRVGAHGHRRLVRRARWQVTSRSGRREPTSPPPPILNYGTGQIRANGTIVGVGVGGAIDLLSWNGCTGDRRRHRLVRAGRHRRRPVVSSRSRPPEHSTHGRHPAARPLAPKETIDVPLPPGVPDDATAVAVTITTTQSPAAGFFTAFPADETRPYASVVNTDGCGPDPGRRGDRGGHRRRHRRLLAERWASRGRRDRLVHRRLGGRERRRVCSSRRRHRRRLLDTRNGDPAWPGGEVEIANVGPNAAALAVNVTMVTPINPGHLTAHAARTALPPTSTVNGLTPDEVAAAMAIVPTSTSGIGVRSSGGADIVVDLAGWFVGAPGSRRHRRSPTNVRPPECTSTTDPPGLNDFFRSGGLVGRRRLPACRRASRRPVPVDVPGRLRPRAVRHVAVWCTTSGSCRTGTCFTLLQSGTYAAPHEFVFPDQTQHQEHWFWPLGGDMGTDGRFHLLVAEMRENGAEYLTQVEPLATWHVAIDLTTMTVVDAAPGPRPVGVVVRVVGGVERRLHLPVRALRPSVRLGSVPVRRSARVRARLGLRQAHHRRRACRRASSTNHSPTGTERPGRATRPRR